MLDREKTVFVLIDFQGKLASLVVESEQLLNRLQILIQGMRLLDVPVLWMEQLPEKLGSTVEELSEVLIGLEPIPKSAFSCAGSSQFMDELKELNPKSVILAGIETHVCVYQTAMDLLGEGFEVHIVVDAVSSRTSLNRQIGIDRMVAEGARMTSVEMLLFELQKAARGEAFKELIRLVK